MRVAAQWERVLVLRLGRFLAVKGPGIIYAIPFLDYVRFVDTRTLTLNIPRQKVITRDNVPAQIDAVLYFLVTDPERAVIARAGFPLRHRAIRAGGAARRGGRAHPG